MILFSVTNESITTLADLTTEEREHVESLQRRLGDMPAPLAVLLECLGSFGCMCQKKCNKFMLTLMRTANVKSHS